MAGRRSDTTTYDGIIRRNVIHSDAGKAIGQILDLPDRRLSVVADVDIPIRKNTPYCIYGNTRNSHRRPVSPDSVADRTALHEAHTENVGEPANVAGVRFPIDGGL